MRNHTLNIKKIIAIFLTLGMLLTMAACTQTDSPAVPSEPTATSSDPVVSDEASPTQEQSGTPENNNIEEPIKESTPEAVKTISYPLDGNHTFTMIQKSFGPVAEALGDGDYSDQLAYAYLAEATGVNIEFTMYGENAYNEKINLSIASQDYPDVFGQGVGSYDNNLIKAIDDEILIDIEPLLDEHMPLYRQILDTDSAFADNVYNSDGSVVKIYGRRQQVASQGLIIRGDWLENLNYDVPETVDELTEVLRAFKSEYDTSLAILINNNFDCGLQYTFGYAESSPWTKDLGFQLESIGGDAVIAGVASEGFIEYLKLMSQYYDEGLINDDFLSTSKELGNFESTYYSGKAGVWYDGCEVVGPSYAFMSSDPNWDAVPMADLQEMTYTGGLGENTSNGCLYISASCAEPEVLLEYLNYGYTEEGSELVVFGVEEITYTKNENGEIQLTELMTNNPDGLSSRTAGWRYLVSGWMTYDEPEQAPLVAYPEVECREAYTLWGSKRSDEMALSNAVALTPEETEIKYQYLADVYTLIFENIPKMIIGEIDEAGYRAVVQQAMSIGLDTITQLYQDAYDRYKA